MKAKTSVYLDPEQAARLKEAAAAAGRSEADLIREGIELVLLRSHRVRRTRPWPSFDSGDPGFAASSEELLGEAYDE
ncbi:ribbon-helix-helix domain-containing protein [Nocardia otitidiscaviarum]|uniref:Ribbon-helix-helix domain-containing protein n=1 Tax=Nocardia otitidiscaviarum TaxID=1823 RepID=A0A516NH38_9NOCA|nr:ribbon-helix-helix domain-containing protein [Nocardia otitidiscaviarum]MCP9625181.1 ribbon-helix-helix domain-containing protein [Nocardia otitidiscaviarum]QDP78222.1 ribbon-helix-helix domain-containing protein [Nocardia otitidiscaviarum]